MKKGVVAILAICLSVIVLMCGSLSVWAATYVIAEDFTNESDCRFLAPGDVNADGILGADDLVKMKKLLFGNTKDTAYTTVYGEYGETAKYSDINGDGFVNIIDIVRQKNNLVKNFVFVDNGAISLNGNSAFTGAFTSVLKKGALYEVSLTYKSDYPITVKMADLNKEIVFDAKAKVSTVTKTFETPLNLNDNKGIDFQIIGVALVESVLVTRSNIDNDIVDNW